MNQCRDLHPLSLDTCVKLKVFAGAWSRGFSSVWHQSNTFNSTKEPREKLAVCPIRQHNTNTTSGQIRRHLLHHYLSLSSSKVLKASLNSRRSDLKHNHCLQLSRFSLCIICLWSVRWWLDAHLLIAFKFLNYVHNADCQVQFKIADHVWNSWIISILGRTELAWLIN